MLENIKKALFAKYKREDSKGLFLSAFDENGKLLTSNGVIYTDKVLDDIVVTLYRGLVQKYEKILSKIVVDVVLDVSEIVDISQVQSISMVKYGLALITGDKFGVILPNMKLVSSPMEALKLIKAKNGLTGNAQIIKFQTDRFVV